MDNFSLEFQPSEIKATFDLYVTGLIEVEFACDHNIIFIVVLSVRSRRLQ